MRSLTWRALVVLSAATSAGVTGCVIDTVPLPVNDETRGTGGAGGFTAGGNGDGVTAAPIITAVTGNGSSAADGRRYLGDGLILVGTDLSHATVALSDELLQIRTQSHSSLEVLLSPSVQAGLQTLTVTNSAGVAQVTVDLRAGPAGSTEGCP